MNLKETISLQTTVVDPNGLQSGFGSNILAQSVIVDPDPMRIRIHERTVKENLFFLKVLEIKIENQIY
jgi:hypothetical protein